MINNMLLSLIKIIALFCISLTLTCLFDLAFNTSESFSHLFRQSVITTTPFALTILYTDYRQKRKGKNRVL